MKMKNFNVESQLFTCRDQPLTFMYVFLNAGDHPSPPGDLAHPHRRGSVQEQRAQMCGVSGRNWSAAESRRCGLWEHPALLQLSWQEEEEAQEEAQS